jgi:RimJ/RimL family protein N-acetyltransferase
MDAAFHPLRLPDRLTDGVIVLDAPTLADAEAHNAGEDTEMRLRFESPRPATLDEHRAAFGRWIAAWEAGGPNLVYAIRGAGGALMGGCEIRASTPDRAGVSYWIYPAFRGRGLAGRALSLLCEAAKATGLTRLEAHVDPDNLASRRTALAAGFVEVGEVVDEEWTGRLARRVLYEKTLSRP